MAIDLSGIDFAMKYVVGAPGFLDKRPIAELIQSGNTRGTVRSMPVRLSDAILPSRSEVHFEICLGKTVYPMRATASEDMSSMSFDAGHINVETTVFMQQPDNMCRCFAVDICPDVENDVWLFVNFGINGRFSVTYGDNTITGPSSDIADALYVACCNISKRKRWRDYARQVSMTRIYFMSLIMKGRVRLPNKLKLPKMSRGRWQSDMADIAWRTADSFVSTFILRKRAKEIDEDICHRHENEA